MTPASSPFNNNPPSTCTATIKSSKGRSGSGSYSDTLLLRGKNMILVLLLTIVNNIQSASDEFTKDQDPPSATLPFGRMLDPDKPEDQYSIISSEAAEQLQLHQHQRRTLIYAGIVLQTQKQWSTNQELAHPDAQRCQWSIFIHNQDQMEDIHPAPDTTLEDQKSIQKIDCERVTTQQRLSRNQPDILHRLKANDFKGDCQHHATSKLSHTILWSVLSRIPFLKDFAGNLQWIRMQKLHRNQWISNISTTKPNGTDPEGTYQQGHKDGIISNLNIFKSRIHECDKGFGHPSPWIQIAFETGSNVNLDVIKDPGIVHQAWTFYRDSTRCLRWILFKDNGQGSTEVTLITQKSHKNLLEPQRKKLKHKTSDDPSKPDPATITSKGYPIQEYESKGACHHPAGAPDQQELVRQKPQPTQPTSFVQETALVSELSTPALVAQRAVSKDSGSVLSITYPDHQVHSISPIQRSCRFFHQRNHETTIHQEVYCYQEDNPAINDWTHHDDTTTTDMDSRSLQSKTTTRSKVSQRPGYAKDDLRISFILLFSIFAFPTPIVRPNLPKSRLGNRNVSKSDHGQVNNHLAHSDTITTGHRSNSVDTFHLHGDRDTGLQGDTASSHPGSTFRKILLPHRTIVASAAWKASPQGPPALQEKMLTKLQNFKPTSQPGTTKPHGLIHMSTVRSDPTRTSPRRNYSSHNYKLNLTR